MDSEKNEALDPAQELEKAWNFALSKISRKERTLSEVRGFLLDKRYSPTIVQTVLDRLSEYRFVDDQRYFAAFSRFQSSRGKGPAYIRMKLKQKGIAVSTQEIQAVTDAVEGKTDVDRAAEIVRRRYPNFVSDRAVAKKAYEALIRRGFSFEVARKAIEAAKVLKEEPSADL